MNLRTTGLAASCAAGLLAVPAGALAATPTTIVAGPLKVKDYSMTVTASDGGSSDSVSVMFNRTSGKAFQMHFYTFSKGVKVTSKSNLAAARIKGSLGKYGKIDVKLVNAGALKRGSVPKGCTGTASKMRAGTLKGTYKLIADSTYFKTIKTGKLKAQLFKGGTLKCTPTNGGNGGSGGTSGTTTLSSTIQGPDGSLTFSAYRDASGAVGQSAMRIDDAAKSAPASVMHMISAPGPGSAFSAAADLSAASGTGVSPFLSGAFSFASETALGTMSMGTLSGTLAAKFDSIGTQQIASGARDAMLMKG
jgi:hypothetical protein